MKIKFKYKEGTLKDNARTVHTKIHCINFQKATEEQFTWKYAECFVPEQKQGTQNAPRSTQNFRGKDSKLYA